ncbi:MAG: aspartyl protease family protein [Treponema sp.]|nr:aspartyl protease family protein [Treponema sp.]
MTVTALVDTGAWTLVINEATRNKLGLDYAGKQTPGTLANGEIGNYDMAGPIEIYWKDRSVICEAIVLPKANDILLGAIPLEAMDLVVNPMNQEVVGAHGDQIMHKIY